ncbi:MAG: DNA polymerase III subunit gamma/tau [Candidatus Ratteibacteria bacterium]|nr:DNA polymerase III subunit gamma/tau [Candidatus Ratteibacteria bacterium]
MYIVLARKYRPKNLDEVWGQSHITEALKKSIKDGRIADAYLFAGPRGTGKTSVARVLAKSLNCENGPTASPCDTCEICKTITAGSCMDVIEIDAASNRKIDEVRALRESVNLTPARARFKIYIIDEVHMLTEDASNALLKTLEEPPPYIKFFLATTDPEQIIPTILSRCQRFNFKPFKLKEVEERLTDICNREGFQIEKEALKEIYGFSGGSMRDALSILDQLMVNAENNIISYQGVKNFLGLVEEDSIREMMALVRGKEIKKLLSLFHQLLSEGKDPAVIMDGIIKEIKGIILDRIGEVEYPEDKEENLYRAFNDISIETLLDAVSLVIEYKNRLPFESIPVVLSEILLLKLSHLLGKEKTIPQKRTEKKEEDVSGTKQAVKEEDIFYSKREEDSPSASNTKEETVSLKNEEEVIAQWKVVLAELKKSKPTLEAALREGSPIKLKDNTLFISFNKKYEFHKSLIESQPRNVKFIEKILSDKTGIKDIKISLVSEGKEESLLDDGEIKKIVEFFGGEIINVEE